MLTEFIEQWTTATEICQSMVNFAGNASKSNKIEIYLPTSKVNTISIYIKKTLTIHLKTFYLKKHLFLSYFILN